MPCRDVWDDTPTKETRHGMTIDHFEATLCGIFTEAEARAKRTGYDELGLLLSHVNWKEAGVKRKTVEIWWKKHKEEDAERRAYEEAKKRKEELKVSAMSKLTEAELIALGLK